MLKKEHVSWFSTLFFPSPTWLSCIIITNNVMMHEVWQSWRFHHISQFSSHVWLTFKGASVTVFSRAPVSGWRGRSRCHTRSTEQNGSSCLLPFWSSRLWPSRPPYPPWIRDFHCFYTGYLPLNMQELIKELAEDVRVLPYTHVDITACLCSLISIFSR